MCTDKDKDGRRIDNKQKTIDVFRRLDWVFIDSDYEAQLDVLSEGLGEKESFYCRTAIYCYG